MTLKPHRKEDLMTFMTGAAYDPTARSALWESFLQQSVDGDAELLHFLHKAVGYSIVGDTREEVLFFVHGPTATGKSTFLEAVKTALGDYAATVDVEAFLSKRFGSGGPSPELAKLRWKRMVVSIEVDEGKHLAEGLIKLITGGDEISVRGLYREPETFKPEFKIWLAANNRPKVSDMDDAIWRRIIVIPFTHQVPPEARDKTLKAKLTTSESTAVLNWAIQGCMLWQEEGLGRPPGAVVQAAADYKKEMDPLQVWIEDNTFRGPAAKTAQRSLYLAYSGWAKATGQRFIMTELQFGQRLTSRGFKATKVSGLRMREGIALLTDRGEPVEADVF